MDKITYPQIKRIFGLAKQAQLNDEELHDLVFAETRSDSIKALSEDQAVMVINRLVRSMYRRNAPPSRATPSQVWQINKLAEELGWNNDSKRLRSFLEKQHEVSHPSYLSPAAASRVIEALKAMKRRAKLKDSGEI